MTEGRSAASDQIGLGMGAPPSAYGISPARGEKGTHSKVPLRGKLPKACPRPERRAEGGVLLGQRNQLYRYSLRPLHISPSECVGEQVRISQEAQSLKTLRFVGSSELRELPVAIRRK